jgi:hypothetical protein
VSPNDTFDSHFVLDPAGTRHLAWVLSYDASDDVETMTQLILYIDAGDGSLLGGDVVE